MAHHHYHSLFPPPGWLTNHEAARMLGVSLESMTAVNWKWRGMLRACGKCVRHPNGGRCNIYACEGVERIIAARDEARKIVIPEGFVDKDGACKMFGVTRCVWKTWIRQGKVRMGETVHSLRGGKMTLYRVEDLQRLNEDLFGEDKLYKRRSDGTYHIPAEFIRREEAWDKFGVSKPTWERWEREGKITCGERVPGGPKLYRIEEIHRMLDEYGRWAPPYPDAQRPGVVRVPLGGRDIHRREAIIDADVLPLIEGGSCHIGNTGEGSFVNFYSPDGTHVPLRRLIMGMTDRVLNVRHVNGDPLDCRRENLIIKTVKQRVRNARKMKTIKGQAPTLQFKGVYWEWRTKRWRATISLNGKTRWLGRFRDEIAAAVAYDEAAQAWFGEDARLNFPDGADVWLAARSELGNAAARAA